MNYKEQKPKTADSAEKDRKTFLLLVFVYAAADITGIQNQQTILSLTELNNLLQKPAYFFLKRAAQLPHGLGKSRAQEYKWNYLSLINNK